IENQHNHELVENISTLTFSYRRFASEMRDDVRLLVACGVRPGAIIEVLQYKNLEKYIHDRNVYNLVNSIYCKKNHVKSDAGSMYVDLIKQQYKNLSFHIDAQFESQDNHLIQLCWMYPSQQDSFEWLFQSLLSATGGLMPRLLYTDANLAMVAT
ncbi:1586_t:CDS:2, partial [Diversispora eburnea]